MTRSERACQIWSLLVLCARRSQVLSYDELSKLIGVPRHGLGQLLEPIQSYCILNERPALSSLVVSEKSGLPGEGFIAVSDVPRAQAETFGFDWSSQRVPSSDDFEAAVAELPSNGRSLEELLARTRANR